jgi:hypothetical protein
LYLAVRPAWWIMGQQTWFVARKPAGARGATAEPPAASARA